MLLSAVATLALLGCSDSRAPVQPNGEVADAVRTVGASGNALVDARARLKPINGTQVRARLLFKDTGSLLAVVGLATGLDPAKTYVSLLYDPGSVPTGPNACLPSSANQLSFTQMVVAYWLPVGSSVRTLSVTKTGASYASLAQVGTSSVRWDTQPDQPLPVAPDPNRFQLQACGSVVADN